VVILVIIKDLAEVINYCLASKIILKRFKKIYNYSFVQKGKKNYFLLSSYKLITFKNTLIKVLKKYIANIIFKAAEEYRLLF